MGYNVIAIEREYASGGLEIGEKLATKLGVPCYNREILEQTAAKLNLSPERLTDVDENITVSLVYNLVAFADAASGMEVDLSLEQKLVYAEADVIKNLSYNPCVLIGRGACALLKDRANILKIFIHADNNARINRAVNEYGIDPKQAESVLRRQDKRRAGYYKITANMDWKDFNTYHLFLNSGKLVTDQAVNLLHTACI